MKKLMIVASAMLMAVAANSKSVETEKFNEVRVNVPARVRVIPGEKYSVHVATADSVLENNVRVSVEDGVLCIGSRYELEDSENRLRITIVAPVEPDVNAGRNFVAKTIANSYPDSKKDVAAK